MRRGFQLKKQTAKQLGALLRKRNGYSLPGSEERFREAFATSETITVFNASGSTVPEFGVLELDGTVVNEADLSLPPDVSSAVYRGITPVNLTSVATGTAPPIWNKRVAIAQQEIANGEIGQCKISGITPVKVYSEKNPNPYQAHVSFSQPLNRLDAAYHNSGFGFPILWRQQGTGEKWALIDLKHFDCPGFYHIRNPLNGTIRPAIPSTVSGTPGNYSVGDYGYGESLWRTSSGAFVPTVRMNSACPMIDDTSGLRVQGRSTWVGWFSGTAYRYLGLSRSSDGKPKLNLGNGYYPYKGSVSISITGNNVVSTIATYTPVWRAISEWPYQSISSTEPSFIADAWNFHVSFVFTQTINVASEVTQPIRILVSVGDWLVSGINSTSPPSYSHVQRLTWGDTQFCMMEVNPAHQFSGPFTLANGGGSSGGTVPGGVTNPSRRRGPLGVADPSSRPLSATVNIKPAKTLSSPYGGTASGPI
jgi:hypothetical protein